MLAERLLEGLLCCVGWFRKVTLLVLRSRARLRLGGIPCVQSYPIQKQYKRCIYNPGCVDKP